MSDAPIPNWLFASDNTAGICPEAWAALAEANRASAPSYGDDPWTAQAKALISSLFERECDVFFVFNGTAANSLALAACTRAPHTRIICHEAAHIATDECGAPEFFGGGTKLTALAGEGCRLNPADVERALHIGHGVHSPKPAALSVTQSTEWGTVYSRDELRALTSLAHANNLTVHMDGARFANAVAATGLSPADLSWRAGVDVLCFGGTKNGMQTAEAVVFFNRELAREFEYRVKQGGQLASKMRFVAAQWVGLLRDGAWLRHAAHANALARRLADEIRSTPGLRLAVEPQVNAVFVQMPPAVHAQLEKRGWFFHPFAGENVYRLMCSWATTDTDIEAIIADLRAVMAVTS
jgi:threonine aldolase